MWRTDAHAARRAPTVVLNPKTMRVLVIDETGCSPAVERALGAARYAVDVTPSPRRGASSPPRAATTRSCSTSSCRGATGGGGARPAPRRARDAGGDHDRRDDDVGLVRGLDAGADDYVLKPVGDAVLTARLRAAVRRGGAPRAD
jgi:hypothetical protein